MAKVQIEVMSWLGDGLGQRRVRRRILEEGIAEGELLRDLFTRLVAKYQPLAKAVHDRATGQVNQQVNIIVNDTLMDLLDGLDRLLQDEGFDV